MDCAFNALHVNSKRPKGVSLKGLRGTDEIIQKGVKAGSGFVKVMTNIVDRTEEHNYVKIGIYCRSGHHRSVACAELLLKFVYPKAIIKHITFNK